MDGNQEQQIEAFVARYHADSALRAELERDPQQVLGREGFSPIVQHVLSQLVPHLTYANEVLPSFTWWH